MSTEPHIQVCSPDDAREPVELIAGPLDGLLKRWPAGETYQDYKYYGGLCTYGYEGHGKAIYLRG